jgi:hypothetical protein
MPVKSAGGKEYEEYEYIAVAVDDCSRAVHTYTRPLRHKSEAPETFKVQGRGGKRFAEENAKS